MRALARRWSSRRPGVATTISGPAWSASNLGVVADAAVDRRRADGPARAVGPDALLDLERELAGRRQDEAADRQAARAASGAVAGRRSWRGCRSAARGAAAGSAARRPPSCRCRSGRRRARRGARGRAGWPRPGRGGLGVALVRDGAKELGREPEGIEGHGDCAPDVAHPPQRGPVRARVRMDGWFKPGR